MVVTTNSTEETKKLAIELAQFISKGDVIALYGDLGSGKTTLTRYIVESLGFEARVQSPTFVILRTYKGSNLSKGIEEINHIDLYRMRTVDEVVDLGIEDLLDSENSICIIEWPELVQDLLPKDTIKIRLETTGEDQRKISFDKL